MNNRGYTKLFNSIVTSSMWSESSDTRVVWVTMLALSNQYGDVCASVPGLARAANVPLESCESALEAFLSPDPYSRTKTHEGRRIVEIPGGWKLLNGEHYRHLMSEAERRDYKRVKESERRQRLKGGVDKRGKVVHTGTNVTQEEEEEEEEASTPPLKEQKRKFPTLEEVKTWASLDGLPEDQAVKFYNHFDAIGWIDGCQRAITNPRARMARWRDEWRERDQNTKAEGQAKKTSGMSAVLAKDELSRVEKAMADLRNSYDPHQTMDQQDKDKLRGFKARRLELMAVLGYTA